MRQLFVDSDKGRVIKVSLEKINLELTNLMGSYREGHEIIEKLMEYLRADAKEDLVTFERVNNMVEFL